MLLASGEPTATSARPSQFASPMPATDQPKRSQSPLPTIVEKGVVDMAAAPSQTPAQPVSVVPW